MMRKIKGRGGFTLAETLLATLILLLVATIMTTGIPAAKTAYEKVILGSNAQLLLSTAVNTLRDELGTAWDVKPSEDGKSVTYFSANTGTKSVIRLNVPAEDNPISSPTIMRQEFAEETAARTTTDFDYILFGDKINAAGSDTNPSAYGNDAVQLVSDAASNKDLYVTYGSISWKSSGDTVIEIKDLAVNRKADKAETPTPIAKLDALEIRVISRAEDSTTSGAG